MYTLFSNKVNGHIHRTDIIHGKVQKICNLQDACEYEYTVSFCNKNTDEQSRTDNKTVSLNNIPTSVMMIQCHYYDSPQLDTHLWQFHLPP